MEESNRLLVAHVLCCAVLCCAVLCCALPRVALSWHRPEPPTDGDPQATSEEAAAAHHHQQQEEAHGRRHSSQPTEATTTDADGPPDHTATTGDPWEGESQVITDTNKEEGGRLELMTREEDDQPESAQGEDETRVPQEGKHTESVPEEDDSPRSAQGEDQMGKSLEDRHIESSQEEEVVQSRPTQDVTPKEPAKEEEVLQSEESTRTTSAQEEGAQAGPTRGEEHPTSLKVRLGKEEQEPHGRKEQYGKEQYSSGQYAKEQYSASSDDREQSHQDASPPGDHMEKEEEDALYSSKHTGGYQGAWDAITPDRPVQQQEEEREEQKGEDRKTQPEPDDGGQYSWDGGQYGDDGGQYSHDEGQYSEERVGRRHEPQHPEQKKAPAKRKRDASGYTLQELLHQGARQGQQGDYYGSYDHSWWVCALATCLPWRVQAFSSAAVCLIHSVPCVMQQRAATEAVMRRTKLHVLRSTWSPVMSCSDGHCLPYSARFVPDL
jgi:hypothetical protein